MPTQEEVLFAVRRLRRQGMSEQVIRNRLVLCGWNEQMILAAISEHSRSEREAARKKVRRARTFSFSTAMASIAIVILLGGSAWAYANYQSPLYTLSVANVAASQSAASTTPLQGAREVNVAQKEPTDDFVYRPKGPGIAATSFLVIDIKNGSILAADNETARVPIASVTKLMSAIVASEQVSPERLIPMPLSARVETAVPRLKTDAQVRVQDLIVLMLTESSNEAAEVLASALGRESFISLMNEKAKEIGLLDTTFGDPSGLSEENISTARDLFVLLQYIAQNRRFIFDLTTGKTEGIIDGTIAFNGIQNFNTIAGVREEFVGGKIGNTDEAKQTYAGVYLLPIEGQKRAIGVIVLGSRNVKNDVRSLLNYINRLYAGR